MKKLVLLLVVVLSSVTIFGQTTKGNFVLSGNTGLQFMSNNVKTVYDGKTEDEYTQSSFSFLPSFGYFVIDNLAIGLSSNISFSTMTDEDGDKNSANSTSILPNVIYYFPLDGKIRPTLQVGVGYSSITNKFIPKTGADDKSSLSGISYNIGGGISYFANDNISFDFGISYSKLSLIDGDDDKSKMNLGVLGSNIGISVYF